MIAVEGTVPFPPTDAGAVSAFGASCATLAKTLGAASTQVTTATAAAVGAWQGQASDAFDAHMTRTTAEIRQLADQLERVQPVITTYAGKIAEAEANYTAAVEQQMAAIAEGGPGGLAAEAAAIAREAAALAQLEAAGVECAGALVGISGSLLKATLPSVSMSDVVEYGADMISELAGTAHEEVDKLTQEVSGYVKKSGAVVEDYVRYAKGVAAKYGTEVKADVVREWGDVAKGASVAAKVVSGAVVVVETGEKFDELVKQGVPEGYAAVEALATRAVPTALGTVAGGAVDALMETGGAAAGAAGGTVVEPGGGTVAGAVEGAVLVSGPALVASTATDIAVTKTTAKGADWLTDQINDLAFHIKPEGPKETVPPPSYSPGT